MGKIPSDRVTRSLRSLVSFLADEKGCREIMTHFFFEIFGFQNGKQNQEGMFCADLAFGAMPTVQCANHKM